MIAISKAIEVVISDQVCDCNRVGVEHIMVTLDQQGDRDQEVIEIVICDQVFDRDQSSVGYTTRSTTRRTTVIGQVYQVCAT